MLDAAVLGSAVLPGGMHETAAALVLYRVIYFLLPLVLTGAVSSAGLGVKLAGASSAPGSPRKQVRPGTGRRT